MANFTVRVELHQAIGADYDALSCRDGTEGLFPADHRR